MRDVPQHRESPIVGSTVHVVVPYKPPDVDEVFYEVHKDSLIGTEASIEESIVEMTIIPRSYSELESHYAEEPLSQIDAADPPAGTYSAPWITEGWAKGTKRPDLNPPDFTIAHKSDENELESNIEPESNENGITEEEVENTSSSPTVEKEPMLAVSLNFILVSLFFIKVNNEETTSSLLSWLAIFHVSLSRIQTIVNSEMSLYLK